MHTHRNKIIIIERENETNGKSIEMPIEFCIQTRATGPHFFRFICLFDERNERTHNPNGSDEELVRLSALNDAFGIRAVHCSPCGRPAYICVSDRLPEPGHGSESELNSNENDWNSKREREKRKEICSG